MTTIRFDVDANVGPAQAKVDAVQAAFMGAAGATTGFADAVMGADGKMRDARGRFVAGAAAVAGVGAAARSTAPALYDVARASDAASKSSSNFGRSVLEVSRAVEDAQYGIAGVLNNIPTLVSALGMGAGVAGALSLVAVGATQVYKHFNAIPEATSAAADAARAHMASVSDAVRDADEELQKLIGNATKARITSQEMAVQEAKRATEKARDEFRDQFGINPLDSRAMDRVASQAQSGMDIWTERWNAQRGEMEKIRVSAKDVMGAYQATAIAYRVAVEEQVLLSKYRTIQAETEAQKVEEAAIDAANAITKAEEDAAKKRVDIARKMSKEMDDDSSRRDSATRGMFRQDVVGGARDKRADAQRAVTAGIMNDAEGKMLSWVAKMGAEAVKHKAKNDAIAERAEQLHLNRLTQLRGDSLSERLAADTLFTDAQMMNLDRLRQHEWRQMQESARLYAGFYDDLGSMAQASTSLAIGLSQDYFRAKIEGAENAEATVAARFLEGMGQQLVGVGTKYAFEGAGMTILGDPRGPVLAGLGVAAIGSGIAMGAGSAAWQHSIAGGTPGKALDDRRGRSETGAPPPSSRGSGGGMGSGLTVNIVTGVGGPLPEDIGREFSRIMRESNERGAS